MVYLVRPDDGNAPTVALPNGEVVQAIEIHPDRILCEDATTATKDATLAQIARDVPDPRAALAAAYEAGYRAAALAGGATPRRRARPKAILRMSWDASTVVVESARAAIAEAGELGLVSFDLEEWDAAKKDWTPLCTWGKRADGKWVSIP